MGQEQKNGGLAGSAGRKPAQWELIINHSLLRSEPLAKVQTEERYAFVCGYNIN